MLTMTNQQQHIVNAVDGYIRCCSVPGSGKTFTLVHRIAHLVNDLSISPSVIVAITFSRRAANTIQSRLKAVLGNSGCCFAGTLHSFCNLILKKEIHRLSYPKNYMLMDKTDSMKLIKNTLTEMNLSSKDYRTMDIMSYISDYKVRTNYVRSIDNSKGQNSLQQKLQDCLQQSDRNIMDEISLRYIIKQTELSALDYNDLIHFAKYILLNNPDALDKWQDKCEYLLFDEYQDISKTQNSLLELLSRKHGNLFVIGDDDQNIYSWRGSRMEYLHNFDKKYPNVQSFTLNQNFRSTPEIIAVANNLICHNATRIQKNMVATASPGCLPVYNCLKDPKEEAMWIVDIIKKNINSGSTYLDHVILVRANRQTREIEQAFIENGIPYKALSDSAFFGSPEIKASLAYLKMIYYLDDLSFIATVNTPSRGFGKKKLEMVQNYAKENNLSLFYAFQALLLNGKIKNDKIKEYWRRIIVLHVTHCNYSCTELIKMALDIGLLDSLKNDPDQTKLDNVSELIQTIYNLEKEADENIPLDELLEYFALYEPSDNDTNKDAVRIMTIHSAKGLEFEKVFIPGLNESILPSSKANTPESLEEERRLFYVGITRAEKDLYISSTEYPFNPSQPVNTSRFIHEMDLKNLNIINPPVLQAPSPIVQESKPAVALFRKQQRIYINYWGNGTIVDIDEKQHCYKILFDNRKQPNTIMFTANIKAIP